MLPFRLHLATPIVWVPEMPFPGFARLDPLLQRLTTREPTLDQLEVSIRALRDVLELEGRIQPTDRLVEVIA